MRTSSTTFQCIMVAAGLLISMIAQAGIVQAQSDGNATSASTNTLGTVLDNTAVTLKTPIQELKLPDNVVLSLVVTDLASGDSRALTFGTTNPSLPPGTEFKYGECNGKAGIARDPRTGAVTHWCCEDNVRQQSWCEPV